MKNLCGSCRRCCKGPLIKVSTKEIADWKEKQRYDIILCIEHWPGHGAYLIRKKEIDECIFLDNEKGCEIYDIRPKICREFPKGLIHVEQFNCHIDPETKLIRA